MCVNVCDDEAFMMSTRNGLTAVKNITIRYISEVEEIQLRVSDAKYMTRNGSWKGAMRAEFKGRVDRNVFEFVNVVAGRVDVVPEGRQQ